MRDILKPEKRQTLAQMAANQLKKVIESGRLAPGDRLLEKEIADSLQIGRNAVREALRSLEKEGMVTITPFKGASVAEASSEDISQMFEAMGGLEGLCAGLAVRKMTDRDLARIEAFHADLEIHYQNKDRDRYLEANWAYHEFIQTLARNQILNGLIADLRQKILLYRRKQLFRPDRFDASMAEHREILKAFRQRDPKLAEEVTKAHLMRQGESLYGLDEG